MARTIRAMSDHLPPCVLENLQQRLECVQLVLVHCLREAQESSQQQTHAVQTDGSSIDVPDRQPILRREHTGARAQPSQERDQNLSTSGCSARRLPKYIMRLPSSKLDNMGCVSAVASLFLLPNSKRCHGCALIISTRRFWEKKQGSPAAIHPLIAARAICSTSLQYLAPTNHVSPQIKCHSLSPLFPYLSCPLILCDVFVTRRLSPVR